MPDTPPSVKDMVAAFRQSLGTNAMMAYLVMMTPRLVELRRVLKPTGSIYLHCDPTAGHYLKVLMDSVFGAQNFRNQIVWRRTTSHSDARGLGRVHDTILLYNKTVSQFTWNNIYQPLDPEYVENYYRYEDSNGRKFMSADLSAAGSGPDRNFGETGHNLACRRGASIGCTYAAGIEELLKNDKIYWTRNGVPRLKVYKLDEHPGIPAQDVWADILPLRSWHKGTPGLPHSEATGAPRTHHHGILQRGRRSTRPILRMRHGCRGGPQAGPPVDGHRHHPPRRRAHEEPAQDGLRLAAGQELRSRRGACGRRQRASSGRAGPIPVRVLGHVAAGGAPA